ncbi:Nramp family divalent metal transporter [Candidatus Curtissbacteria bacterium]|nr:Nramp family divalent metal transporter [Candidatus Curtissbacteria bacterium]
MRQKLKKILSRLGPGFITGASDDDPSGIATYSQAGAQFGYSQLWTALFSFPFMTVIQEMCGRIGMVTGKGLSGVIRTHYSKKVLYLAVFLLLVANTVNIGADLGAMASSAELLVPLPFTVLLLAITAVILLLEVFVSYRIYARILKYLTFSLFFYIIAAFLVKQDWAKIAYATFVPTFSLSRDYLLNIVAILGTTISPYLFFWQSDEEVEQEVQLHKIRAMGKGVPKITKIDVREMRVDTTVGMFFSNLVMFFIIVTAASTLGVAGLTSINTAADAAQALRPIAGDLTFFLFAMGIIGTGLLAVPVLSGSASYAVSEAFGLKEGLYRKFKQAHGFYGIITVATIVGLLVNFTGIPPFKVLYYTAVLNGIIAPPLMVLILLISNSSKIMGQYTNSKFSNISGWLITAVLTVSSLALLISFWV